MRGGVKVAPLIFREQRGEYAQAYSGNGKLLQLGGGLCVAISRVMDS